MDASCNLAGNINVQNVTPVMVNSIAPQNQGGKVTLGDTNDDFFAQLSELKKVDIGPQSVLINKNPDPNAEPNNFTMNVPSNFYNPGNNSGNQNNDKKQTPFDSSLQKISDL